MLKIFKQCFSPPFFAAIVVLCVVLGTPKTYAQEQQQTPDYYYSIWGGYSFNSVKLLGKTGNSQTSIFALGYRREIMAYHGKGNLYYSADLIPYLNFDYPKRDENFRRVSRNGFGLSPVGFLWKEKSMKAVVPFVHTTGGLIYMESEFPTDLSRRLNFTFDITLGANLKVGKMMMFSLGYKFHHISNAETGKHNPGLDSNFLFLSISTQ